MKRLKVAVFPALFAVALLSGTSGARAQEYYMDLHVGYNIVDNGDLEYDSATFPAGYEPRIGSGSDYAYGSGSEFPLRPYIGIGGGGARYTMEATDNLATGNVIDDTTYGLVYQGILGLGVAVTETALVTLDFRYLVSDNVKFSDVAGTAFEVDAIQATAMFGLRTTFRGGGIYRACLPFFRRCSALGLA